MTAPLEPKPRLRRLLLIRHGEVEERYQRIFGGRIDMNLSANGEQQAERLASSMAHLHVDRLYCSPMKRAQRTAAPIAGAKGLPIETLPDLREVDFGVWTGHAWHEIPHKFGAPASSWLHHLDRDTIEGAESGERLVGRLRPIYQAWLENQHSASAAVVCHGGVIRALLSLILNLPLPATANLDVDYGSLTAIQLHEHGPELTLLNYAPWRAASSH